MSISMKRWSMSTAIVMTSIISMRMLQTRRPASRTAIAIATRRSSTAIRIFPICIIATGMAAQDGAERRVAIRDAEKAAAPGSIP